MGGGGCSWGWAIKRSETPEGGRDGWMDDEEEEDEEQLTLFGDVSSNLNREKSVWNRRKGEGNEEIACGKDDTFSER